MESLRDKVCIITGASSGIGAETARYFARHGAILSLTGRNTENLEAVAFECRQAGLTDDKVLTLAGDITDDKLRKDLVQTTIKKFGRLDVLVNNAGVSFPSPLSSVTGEAYDKIMNINTRSPVLLTQLAIPHLKQTKGCVVNVSSTGGSIPVQGFGTYCMSKAAVDMFTKSLARELAPFHVRVNSLNPGGVKTSIARDMGLPADVMEESLKAAASTIPLGFIASPEHIAPAIAFLASEAAAYMTGSILQIDGGAHLEVTGVPVPPRH